LQFLLGRFAEGKGSRVKVKVRVIIRVRDRFRVRVRVWREGAILPECPRVFHDATHHIADRQTSTRTSRRESYFRRRRAGILVVHSTLLKEKGLLFQTTNMHIPLTLRS
jgi:hypothetical protein